MYTGMGNKNSAIHDDLHKKINEIKQKTAAPDEKSSLEFAAEIIVTQLKMRVKELENILCKVIIVIEGTKNQIKSQQLKNIKDECRSVLNNSCGKV